MKKTYQYAIACPTSMGVRITPPERMAVQNSNLFYMQATSAESNVLNVASSLGQECLVLTKFVKGSPIADFIKRQLRARNIRFEVCGARAQGRSAECGIIELGMDADLILLDFNQPHLIPCHNVLSHLVYAASGHDVALTMVRGKILYADGKYPTLDIAGALKELHDYAIPRVFSDEPEAQA